MGYTTPTYEKRRDEYTKQRDAKLLDVAILEERLQDPRLVPYERYLIQQRINRALRYIDRKLHPKWYDMERRAAYNHNRQVDYFNFQHSNGGIYDTTGLWDQKFQPYFNVPKEDRDEFVETVTKSKKGIGKRAMLLWSNPHDYIAKKESTNLPVPVRAVIIDPSRIPDGVFEALGILTFDKNDRPDDRLKKKEKAVLDLKEMLHNSKPIHFNNFRLIVLPNGKLLYSREAAEDKDTGLPRLEAGVYDAYSAYRKTFHEEHSYQRETFVLVEWAEEIRDLNKKLKKWRVGIGDAEKARLEKETEEKVTKWQEFFGECKNKYKLTALELLRSIMELSDKRGVKNVTVCMTKMVSAVHRLDERMESDIRSKIACNAEDRHDLLTNIQVHERKLHDFRTWIQDNWREILQTKSLDGAPSLKGICLEPFVMYANKINEMMEALSTSLDSDEDNLSREILVVIHLVGKFLGIRICFAQMYNEVIDVGHTTVGYIRNHFIKPLRSHFDNKQVLKEMEVEGFQPPYEQMQANLELIETMMADMPPEEEIDKHHPLYKEVKKFMEANSPEMLVSKLPTLDSLIDKA